MTTTYVISFLCVALICGLTIYVTKLAYSRKWEDED